MLQTIADFAVLAAVAYLVFLYRSAIVPFTSSYAGEKGKRLATHEDFEQILREQRLTTRELEVIKSQVGDGIWLRQTLWREKKELYFALIECADALASTFHQHGNGLKPNPDRAESALDQLTKLVMQGLICLEDEDARAALLDFGKDGKTAGDSYTHFSTFASRLTEAARRELVGH